MSDNLLSLKTREVPKDFMAIVDQEIHHATDADVQVGISYIRPVVEKFAQVQLNFDFDVNEQDWLYQATTLLRKPLKGKTITLVTDAKDVCLSPCLGFRCKSFNFQDCENARNLDAVTAVIESDIVVEDTVGAYIGLWKYADKVLELPTVSGRQFVDVYEDELGKFYTSALSWDLQGLQKYRAVCWAAVKAWMEAWSVAELERVTDEKKRVLEQFSEWDD